MLNYDLDKMLYTLPADQHSVEEIRETLASHPEVKFVSVDVDEEAEIAIRYGVSSIPCLVFLKNGEEVGRSVGFRPKDALEAAIGDLT